MPKTADSLKGGIVAGLAFAAALYATAYGAATARWLLFATLTGDWLNDWLTHMPQFLQELVIQIVRGG